jgi:ATP sulfurylase
VFDSFETTGVGKLIGWLSAVQSPYSNRCSNGSPVYRTTLRLTAGMGPPSRSRASDHYREHRHADLSASLIGSGLLQALDLPPVFTRQQVAENLAAQRAARVAASTTG